MTFSNEAALHAINFISALKHTKGRWAGAPFDLLPWQHELLAEFYGTLNERGLRQYQFCYTEIPKKNGKSELAAGVALYHVFADGEPRGEIYGCAADRAQASLVYDVAVDMVAQCPALKRRAKITLSNKQLIDKVTGSKYKVLSADAFSKHGVNASCVVFDELHAQPNRDLWGVMTAGSGDAREQPVWWVITTAGDDPDRHSIGWEIHNKAERIISGEIYHPTWLCRIWGIPEDFEGYIYDEDLWYKVNPSLGATITIEKMRQAALAARNNEADEKLFRWLRLNQWISLKRTGWLPLTLWDKTAGDFTRADMLGERVYVGLDLSTRFDLTAAALLFPPKKVNRWRCSFETWVPEENIAERVRRDHVPYDTWVKGGFLNATPGNVVDYGYIKNWIEKIEMDYDVQYYCADPWHLEILRQLLPREIARKFIEIPQTMAGMTAAMGELERLFSARQLEHDPNPLARWAFGNVAVQKDGNENQKPMKNKSIERIDPIVALIDAMAGAIRLEKKQSVYEQRGIRVV